MKVYFLQPGDNLDVVERICECIKNSKSIIKIAVAYFTDKQIADALIERTKNGLRTELILNTSDLLRPEYSDGSKIVVSKELLRVINLTSEATPCIQIRTLGYRSKGRYQNMHHKFMIGDNEVFWGSVNWTFSALNNNYECLTVSGDISVRKQFDNEFNIIWERAADLYSSAGEIRRILCPICEASEGVDFESYGPMCTFCGHRFDVI